MRYLSELASALRLPGTWCFLPAYAGAPPGVCVLAQYEHAGPVFGTAPESVRECHETHAVVLQPERFPPCPTT